MTGSRGARLASEYIAERLQEAGLQPLGENETFFQQFKFTSGMKIAPRGNELAISYVSHDQEEPAPAKTFAVQQDFRPLSFSADGQAVGEVAFAGYGLVVPGGPGEGYDSYAGLDVNEKIVLVLRYVPEEVSVERRQLLNRYAGLRYKALAARERGAKGLLVVTGPNSPNAGRLVPLTFDQSSASSGIVAASISDNAAEAILHGSGITLKELQTALDAENTHPEIGPALAGVQVRVSTKLERQVKDGRNVIATLPAPGSAQDAEYVMIGAHFDHIGRGEGGGSLAHKGEEGQVHNGADDNASGVAVVLELAAELANRYPSGDWRRGLIVAWWSGEELGTIGSSHFVQHPPVPLDSVIAYLNFDMVGRLRENKLVVQGVGSSPAWGEMLERRNVPAGFALIVQDDPYLPTDSTPLYLQEVPVLQFFTGSHEDYNRPTDDADRLNYPGMERIARLAGAITCDLLSNEDRPAYAKVERRAAPAGARDSLRAYTGTIPDFTAEGVTGLRLAGVRAGGPADKAGLKGGDVIVQFAGQDITNIYDYTYALDAVKIGQQVTIVVEREGKRLEFTIVPEARE